MLSQLPLWKERRFVMAYMDRGFRFEVSCCDHRCASHGLRTAVDLLPQPGPEEPSKSPCAEVPQTRVAYWLALLEAIVRSGTQEQPLDSDCHGLAIQGS